MTRFDRPPEIDYLAKDFASFRQLMLDQIALLIPDWQEQHPADLGNALVDILAYAADYLSYYQDGVATEAYLGTARLRRSVRRHARLLDYELHDGCNARTWVHIALKPGSEDFCLLKGAVLLAGVDLVARQWVLTREQAASLLQESSVQVFLTMHDVHLSAALPEIAFHVEDRAGAILHRGAVTAHLEDSWLDRSANRRALDDLRVGDVLVLEQQLDPGSGLSAGVDPSHRHAIRLTKIERVPAVSSKFRVPGASSSEPHVRITWDAADALPFDLPVGPYRVSSGDDNAAARQLSVALRNIVLVDHGAWVDPEPLPPVDAARRYRPYLLNKHVTCAVSYDHAQARTQPASAAIVQRPYDAKPVVELTEQHVAVLPEAATHQPLLSRLQGEANAPRYASVHRWVQQRDLLSSDQAARIFAVETEDDGRVYLRFGFGGAGREPAFDSTLIAAYRVGNGSQGNVGRHAIAHIVADGGDLATRVAQVRNPLPVTSGIDAELIDAARLAAPVAFQTHISCISPDDYAAHAERFPGGTIRQARARIESTGNWQTVFVYVQRQDDQPLDQALREQLLAWLQRRAMAGYEVAIRPPAYVDVALHVRVWAAAQRFSNAVRRAVTAALGNAVQEDGRPGFFHPNYLGFGRPIYRSQIIRAAMAVEGVARVEIVHVGRLDDARSLDPVPIGALEIARLAVGPGHPERGALQIDMAGDA